jgi:cell division protein FtsI/penicillin-binding protein 2
MKMRKILIYSLIIFTFIYYVFNLIRLQFSNEGKIYKEMAKRQFLIKRTILPKRGTIYDRKLREIAFSVFEENKFKREYPYKEVCAPLIGFVGEDGKGLEGIEYYYDKILSGEKGYEFLYRTRNGKLISLPDLKAKNAKPGKDIVLTIDMDIQEIAYRNLVELIKFYNGERGFVIIMNPKNGEILSLASYPSYDPYKIPSPFSSDYRCLPVTYLYEPGSVFKIVTYATFIKEKKYENIYKVDITPGSLIIKGIEIHDPENLLRKTYIVSPEEVIIYSSNIGISKLAQTLPSKKLYETALLMGFGIKTGIDFPGEETGKLKDYKEWDEIYKCTFSFGQGIFVNGIQIALAYAQIANGGYLLQPYILKEIIDGKNVKFKSSPKIIRKVFNEEELKIIKNTLKRVVEEGSGIRAKFANISICGKTGTAEKYDPNTGDYNPNKVTMSFIGFFPEENPKYLIYVLIDEPKKGRFASEVVVPLWKKIAKEIYEIEKLKEIDKNLLARNEIE